MKKITILIAALFAISTPMASLAMDHDMMKMKHDVDMISMGKPVHTEVVDGVKATFNVLGIQKAIEEMGTTNETHHIMVVFTDAKTDKKLNEGDVKMKVLSPDKSEQVKDLMKMEGGFGSDFTMYKKGKYRVTCKFQLNDGKVHSIKFWYTIK